MPSKDATSIPKRMTDIEQHNVPPSVKRGMEWLDEHVPGWWTPERINVIMLFLSSHDWCICGQLDGGFSRFVHNYHLKSGDAKRLGFLASNETDYDYSVLTTWWRTVILDRRAKEQV